MHSHSLFLKIRFFLLIRRRELSNSISLQKCFHQIRHPHFLHFQPVKKEKHRCVLLTAVLVSYLYAVNNSSLIRKLLQKSIVFLPEVSGVVHSVFSPEVLSIHFLRKLLAIQQSLSACEAHRVPFLIHRSRDAPADERFRFFFLHFLRFMCIYFMVFMQKSQRSFPRPSVMLLSQISFGCRPV